MQQEWQCRTVSHFPAVWSRAHRVGMMVFCLWLGCAIADDAPVPALSETITGGEFEYVIQPGDFLIKISARYGVDPVVLARENGIDYHGYVYPGQRLRITNRHIVPERLSDGILINLPQRMLFLFRGGELRASYPVGLGRPTWRTPAGDFTVRTLELNKEWIVPKSIQEEMRREGKIVNTSVPPGPDNPLGKYWIGLSRLGYGIHSTIAPVSIYQFQSHGCIRLHPDDIGAMFAEVRIGMPVRIIYQNTLLARLPDGRIFLEVHPDAYNAGTDPLAEVQAQGIGEHIDEQQARAMIAARDGLAQEITRPADK
ncbi:MAG: hypothetical protein FD165_2399 [Gammaproteobacteria bacterium]|nr:MAG: hypothetical protein FD165_2399 [Gammaproteobacteria bacterium]TND01002.1 MAG: hypothetical protein FD120_2697 [Gammaproteobacteria bacterium]